MTTDFKSLAISNIKAKSSGRIRVGIAALHGVVDSWGDRSHPGAFAKTLTEKKHRIRFLWNHDSRTPPIATIVDVKEIGAAELPGDLRDKYPTATGGLEVTREYYTNDLASWVLEAVDKGDVNEMSYAYDVVKSDPTDEEIESSGSRRVRELRELKLYDLSDVNWGMNEATLASVKGFNLEALPLGTLYQSLLIHTEEFKQGRRNSASDETLINQIHALTLDLGAKCQTGDESEKSAEESETKQAEAGMNDSTSLNSDWLYLRNQKAKILSL